MLIPNRHWGGEGLLGCVFGCVTLCLGSDIRVSYSSPPASDFFIESLHSPRIVYPALFLQSYRMKKTNMTLRNCLFQQIHSTNTLDTTTFTTPIHIATTMIMMTITMVTPIQAQICVRYLLSTHFITSLNLY